MLDLVLMGATAVIMISSTRMTSRFKSSFKPNRPNMRYLSEKMSSEGTLRTCTLSCFLVPTSLLPNHCRTRRQLHRSTHTPCPFHSLNPWCLKTRRSCPEHRTFLLLQCLAHNVSEFISLPRTLSDRFLFQIEAALLR